MFMNNNPTANYLKSGQKQLPKNATTVIIVLGQCTLPNGQPHHWLIERVDTAYSILAEKNLDLNTTYFIVSGSDVSNRLYGIFDKKKMHPSQAYLMYTLLQQIHASKTNDQNNFSQHIILDQKANTTIQNFYYAFKILDMSNMREHIKNVYVVTSDFHMQRSRFVFQTLFFKDQFQVIGNPAKFNYKENVHYIQSKSVWTQQQERVKKFKKQQRLYNDIFLQSEAKKTGERLWSQIKILK